MRSIACWPFGVCHHVALLQAGLQHSLSARSAANGVPQWAHRVRVRRAGDPCVFRRDGVTVRAWRHALRDACRKAEVPHRLLHDCRRTAARNLIRVPERIAMLLTGHKTRSVFDRYNIVNEQELLTAGARLAAYLADERSKSGAA